MRGWGEGEHAEPTREKVATVSLEAFRAAPDGGPGISWHTLIFGTDMEERADSDDNATELTPLVHMWSMRTIGEQVRRHQAYGNAALTRASSSRLNG